VFQGQRFRGKDRLDDLVEALHDAGMERGETPRQGSAARTHG